MGVFLSPLLKKMWGLVELYPSSENASCKARALAHYIAPEMASAKAAIHLVTIPFHIKSRDPPGGTP